MNINYRTKNLKGINLNQAEFKKINKELSLVLKYMFILYCTYLWFLLFLHFFIKVRSKYYYF